LTRTYDLPHSRRAR